MDRVVEGVRFDQEAELLGGFERTFAARTTGQLCHEILVAQRGQGGRSLGGWKGESGEGYC